MENQSRASTYILFVWATNISQAMQRKSFSSGTLWESIIGYSPSVRFGDIVYISGTTASDKQGNIVGIDDPYLQTIQIINNIRIALEDRGANLEDIVRTRIYVINIGN